METLMTNELSSTLNTVIKDLAAFFGTTTQTVIENLPSWLASYGWYITLKDLGWNLGIGVILGGICLLGFWGLMEDTFSQKTKIVVSIVWVLFVALLIALPLIICAIVPELTGLEAILKYING